MVDKLILKNSVVLNKAPALAQMAAGELAINRNEASPGLYIRTGTGAESSSDKIVRIGPAYLAATEPTVVGGTGITPGSSWLNTSSQRLSIFTTQGWVPVRGRTAAVGVSQPSAPIDGDMWFDTEIAALKVWIASAAAWVEVSSSSKMSVYYGEADPRVSADQVTVVGFRPEADGSYYGQKDFRGLSSLTAGALTKPAAGFLAGQSVATDEGSTIYQKLGTRWYCWRRGGHWYIADAATTGSSWLRSNAAGAASPNLVASWISLTGDEAQPPRSGSTLVGVSVRRGAPLSLSVGETWFDLDEGGFKVWGGSAWLQAGASQRHIERTTPRIVCQVNYASPVTWTISGSRFLVPVATETLDSSFFERSGANTYRVKKSGIYQLELSGATSGLTGGSTGTTPSYHLILYRATSGQATRFLYVNDNSSRAIWDSRSVILRLDKGEDLQVAAQGLTLGSITRTLNLSGVQMDITVLYDLEA